MVTIVRGTIPAEEFALDTTTDRLDDVSFETERVVRSGDDAIMPLMWVRGVDRDTIERAFEEDRTVNEVTLLADFGDELLYRMEWIDHIHLLLQMLTNSHATILDAYGRGDKWQIRVLYPDREGFSETHEFCEEHGMTFDVDSIRELEGQPSGRFGLTADQYQALVTAVEEGYFSVPRDMTLQELADKFDVSHQALSERLRRGTEALVEDALLVGEPPRTPEE